jgi:phospho-N-acetylmuramoyl-pentapeptide-transferase
MDRIVAALLADSREARMLLELARWLQGCALLRLFDYLTIRAILGALTALALSLWLGPA